MVLKSAQSITGESLLLRRRVFVKNCKVVLSVMNLDILDVMKELSLRI